MDLLAVVEHCILDCVLCRVAVDTMCPMERTTIELRLDLWICDFVILYDATMMMMDDQCHSIEFVEQQMMELHFESIDQVVAYVGQKHRPKMWHALVLLVADEHVVDCVERVAQVHQNVDIGNFAIYPVADGAVADVAAADIAFADVVVVPIIAAHVKSPVEWHH